MLKELNYILLVWSSSWPLQSLWLPLSGKASTIKRKRPMG